MNAYEKATSELFQAGFSDFVAERKRLAAELKATGDKEAAARLAKLPRPSVSAWVVNQLWWRERATFEALFGAAERLRAGDRDGSQAHRQALSTLREGAARLLQESGHAASDATLRRVLTTLAAVAARGSFEPDLAGALTHDRDPPGFEVMQSSDSSHEAPPPARGTLGERVGRAVQGATEAKDLAAEAERRRAEEAEQRRAAEAERRRAEEAERKRRQAERERLSAELRDAKLRRDAERGEVEVHRSALATAERQLEQTETLVASLEHQLANL